MSRLTFSVAEPIDPTVRYEGTVDPNKNYTFCNTMHQNPEFHFLYLGNITLNADGLLIPHGKGKYTYGDGPDYNTRYNIPRYFDHDRQRASTHCPEFNGGSTYEGNIQYGKINGYGIHKDSNGDIYEGQFIDDAYNGYGVFRGSKGDIYKGQFVNNTFNGDGNYTWANGNTYEGPFENNNPHGRGIFIWANHGNSKNYAKNYVGNFKNGNMTDGHLRFNMRFNNSYSAHFENKGEYLELTPTDMVTIRTINGRFIKKTGRFIKEITLRRTPGNRTPGRTPRRTPRRTPGHTPGNTPGNSTPGNSTPSIRSGGRKTRKTK